MSVVKRIIDNIMQYNDRLCYLLQNLENQRVNSDMIIISEAFGHHTFFNHTTFL